MMNNKKTTKTKPIGRPQVSTSKRPTKSVTVKFSKPDYKEARMPIAYIIRERIS